MANKKIKINSNIKNDFITENTPIEDISLKFSIIVESRVIYYDLSTYLTGLSKEQKLKKRKEFLKIIAFVKNTKRSSKTLKNILKRVLFLLKENHDLFFEDKDSLFKTLKKHQKELEKDIIDQKIKASSAEAYRSLMISFLIDCFNYQEKELKSVFPKVINRTGKLTNAIIEENNTTYYLKEDLQLMVSVFLGLAKHCDYLLNNLNNTREPLKPFILENYIFDFEKSKLCERSIKNMKTTMLLFAFISLTGSNLTPAITAKRKDVQISDGELNNIDITLKCKRKNKIQNHKFTAKRKQLKFFNEIILNSKNIDPSASGLLFPTITSDSRIEQMRESQVNGYYRKFKKNPIKDNKGNILAVNARTLRQSYANLFNGTTEKCAALFNSTQTASKHYSHGDFKKNNASIQNGMNIYTMSLRENKNMNESKIKYIALKDITDEDRKITSNGLICVNSSNSEMENKFKRKSSKAGFNTEHLSCANVLACFKCENAILTDSFETNYLLLSLKHYLEDSLYDSESSGLFGDRHIIKESINDIDFILNNQISKKELKKAQNFINENGKHPLWEKL